MKKEKVKCQNLNANGRRCGKTPTRPLNYFGENELYDYGKKWVRVFLCEKHMVKK